MLLAPDRPSSRPARLPLLLCATLATGAGILSEPGPALAGPLATIPARGQSLRDRTLERHQLSPHSTQLRWLPNDRLRETGQAQTGGLQQRLVVRPTGQLQRALRRHRQKGTSSMTIGLRLVSRRQSDAIKLVTRRSSAGGKSRRRSPVEIGFALGRTLVKRSAGKRAGAAKNPAKNRVSVNLARNALTAGTTGNVTLLVEPVTAFSKAAQPGELPSVKQMLREITTAPPVRARTWHAVQSAANSL